EVPVHRRPRDHEQVALPVLVLRRLAVALEPLAQGRLRPFAHVQRRAPRHRRVQHRADPLAHPVITHVFVQCRQQADLQHPLGHRAHDRPPSSVCETRIGSLAIPKKGRTTSRSCTTTIGPSCITRSHTSPCSGCASEGTDAPTPNAYSPGCTSIVTSARTATRSPGARSGSTCPS